MKNKFITALLFLLYFNLSYSQQNYPLPINVTAMLHIDPLISSPDSNVVIANYNSHRDAISWYKTLVQTYGSVISAQMTGVYAEACIRRGHWSDFINFMSGGIHHLGTHLHANVKSIPPRNYYWRTFPNQYYNTPDSVRKVFHDNIYPG